MSLYGAMVEQITTQFGNEGIHTIHTNSVQNYLVHIYAHGSKALGCIISAHLST